MTDVWVAFWVGMFLGAWIGVFALALCVVAGRADERRRMINIKMQASATSPSPLIGESSQVSIARNGSRVLLEHQES